MTAAFERGLEALRRALLNRGQGLEEPMQLEHFL